MDSDYPKEMLWRANLAAMYTGGSREDCLQDLFVFVECDGLSLDKAYAKTCYKNSSAGMQGRLGDANLIVNHTDFGENYVFQDHSNQGATDTWLDIKSMNLDATEKLILYMLSHKETGTQISKQLGCSVKTAIRKISKLRSKLEKAIK